MDEKTVSVDLSLATLAERKLENSDGAEFVAPARSHERVTVFLAVRHQGNPSLASPRLSLTVLT